MYTESQRHAEGKSDLYLHFQKAKQICAVVRQEWAIGYDIAVTNDDHGPYQIFSFEVWVG